VPSGGAVKLHVLLPTKGSKEREGEARCRFAGPQRTGANRKKVYEAARTTNSLGWSSQTRNWSKIEEVYINAKKETKPESDILRSQAA
jgi:hypothetical protein